MFCEKCGSQLENGEKFCPYCGNPVEPVDQMDSYAPEEPQVNNYQPEYQQDDYQNDYSDDYQDDYSDSYQDDYQPQNSYRAEKKVEKRKPVGVKKKKASQRDRDLEEEWAKEEKKDKITFIILGVVIVALVVVIFFVVRSLIGSDSKDKPHEDQQIQADVTVAPDTPEPTDTPKPTDTPTPTSTPTPTPEATEEPTPTPTVKATPQVVAPTPGTGTTVVTPVPGQTADTGNDYIIADSSARYLTNADLKSLSQWEIRVARNEIYARHGRKFTTKELQDYFDSKDWYSGTIAADKFNTDVLNTVEKANLQFIVEYEKDHNLNQ